VTIGDAASAVEEALMFNHEKEHNRTKVPKR